MKNCTFFKAATIIFLTVLLGVTAISCDTEDKTIPTWDRSYTANSATMYKSRFVFETSEENLVSYGGTSVLDLLCTTPDGEIIWEKSFSDILNSSYQTYQVIEIPHHFLVICYVDKTYAITRIVMDEEGNQIEQATIPVPFLESVRGIDITEETIFVAVRDATSGSWFKKLSRSGETLWTLDATDFVNDVCTFLFIKATKDGGAVVVGRRNDDSDKETGCVAKIDSDGTMAWTTYVQSIAGSPAASWDSPKLIFETQDGGFLYTAHYGGPGGEAYVGSYIAKISRKGNVTAKVLFSGTYANCAKETPEKSIIVAGFDSSFNVPSNDVRIESFYIQKMNAMFGVQWKREFEVVDGSAMRERMLDISETSDGGYITASGYPYNSIYWLTKVNNKGNLNP